MPKQALDLSLYTSKVLVQRVRLLAVSQVMYARQHERQAMKDALEMAVLTTVSHPNIIQVTRSAGLRVCPILVLV